MNATNTSQTSLTDSQDNFLQEMAHLISQLSITVSILNEQKNNMYTMINMLDRIEQKIDSMSRQQEHEHIR